MFWSKSVYYSLSEEPNEELEATQTRDTHPHSDGEQSPTERWWRLMSLIELIYFFMLSEPTESVSVETDELILFSFRSLFFSVLPVCSLAAHLLRRATLSFWLRPTTPLGLRCSGTGEVFLWYSNPTHHAHMDVDVLSLPKFFTLNWPLCPPCHSYINQRGHRWICSTVLISTPLKDRTPLTWVMRLWSAVEEWAVLKWCGHNPELNL